MRRPNGRKQPGGNFQDMGFGTSVAGRQRMVNQDGSFNVKRRGRSYFEIKGIYHWLIRMSWFHLMLLILSGYIVVNSIFACVYMAVGVDHLDGMEWKDGWGKFSEAFFFSAQTFTTVGYGRVSPTGFGANLVAAMESMLGLISFALGTSILWGRFSRPSAKILFSSNALISPYGEGKGFMFRIANQRDNQLIEVEVSVGFSMLSETDTTKRDFYGLTLERKSINFFPLSWTIVHPIDEESPMYGISLAELKRRHAEWLVLIKAFDDTFSQTVYQRSSYKAEELVKGAKFNPIFGSDENGQTMLDLHRINEYIMVDWAEEQELQVSFDKENF